MLAKQNISLGLSSFGDQWGSGQSLGARIPKALVLAFPAWPTQVPGTAAVKTIFISILIKCPCWVQGLGSPVPQSLKSTCGPFQLRPLRQQICIIPVAMGFFILF
eukprot:1114757-Pelagomonas_calceolata.AAC.2